jgi:pimeloyl-ACP methyl ester carboxylesterase
MRDEVRRGTPRERSRRARTADGVEVAAHDLGGAGPTLVLAHATGLHGLVWRALAVHLVDTFRCVSLDHRGHGDSPAPPGSDFDWTGLGLDVLAVVDGLDLTSIPPLYAVGHSSGGTAVLLAEMARPGTFDALYCFEPVLVAADPPLGRDTGNWLAAGARRRRDRFGSREEARAHYAARPPFAGWAPDAVAAYVEHGLEDAGDGTVRLKCRPDDEALVYEMATAHDGFSRLADVRCPVMLASGERTEAFTPAARAALVDRLPDARTEVLPGLDHFGPLEDPAAVASSIRRFLC